MSLSGVGYPYGASYSPLIFPESEWERDLTALQQACMNLVRIGDVHGSWDRIEPREGDLRLDRLERFYAAAARHDIHVLLSSGACCPPLWLATKYPDVTILSNRGERYPLAASYHWACIHHPGFREASDAYLGALAQFAAKQPNHFGWQISNEIGFPFLPTRESDELSLYCYCKHCKVHFRTWLQERYTDLETLSTVWTWSTTAYWYNDWDEVDPPEALPAAWSGVTRWIDWRLFWQDAFARFAAHQHALIKQYDPDRPTSVNTFNFKGYDRFGAFTGLDQWKLSKAVDHIGYDLYPGSGDKLRTRPEHISMFLDHGRSVSQAAGSDLWLHEIESGPIGGWVLGPEHNTLPQHIWRNGIESLGHDAKLMLYMPWREWEYQPLHWGALVDLDGNPTPRLQAATDLGNYIRSNATFLREARTSRGEVGLIESKANAIFLRGIHQEQLLFKAQRGAYQSFWGAGFHVDFLTPDLLREPYIHQYRVLCLPMLTLLDSDTAEQLRGYVYKGGLLIGFARCGSLSERGWYHRRLPVPGLQEAFGIDAIEADDDFETSIRFEQEEYSGALRRDLITPREDVEVLATFSDGHPAVTMASHGRGQGLYFATHADLAVIDPGSPLLGKIFRRIMERKNLHPQLMINTADNNRFSLDPHVLEGQRRTTILIANSAASDTTATLSLDCNDRIPERVESGWLDKAPVKWQQKRDRLILRLNLRGEKGEAIDIAWKD